MYLSLYYYERSTINVEDVSEDKYLNTLYNFNNVKKCIKKLGIVIEDLQPIIDNILDEISPINIIPFNNIRVFKDFTTPYEILWEEVLSTIGINLSQIIGSNGEGLSIQFYNYTGLTSTNQIINSYTPGIPDIFTYTDIVNEVIYPWIFSTVFIKGITQATPVDEIFYFKVFNTNNPSIYYNIRIFLRIV